MLLVGLELQQNATFRPRAPTKLYFAAPKGAPKLLSLLRAASGTTLKTLQLSSGFVGEPLGTQQPQKPQIRRDVCV